MAILILICGMLILSQIFLTSMRTVTQVQQRTRAVVLAENVLQKIRSQDAAAFRAGPAPAGPATPISSSVQSNGLSTSVQSDPWALFVNNISALYYFP